MVHFLIAVYSLSNFQVFTTNYGMMIEKESNCKIPMTFWEFSFVSNVWKSWKSPKLLAQHKMSTCPFPLLYVTRKNPNQKNTEQMNSKLETWHVAVTAWGIWIITSIYCCIISCAKLQNISNKQVLLFFFPASRIRRAKSASQSIHS